MTRTLRLGLVSLLSLLVLQACGGEETASPGKAVNWLGADTQACARVDGEGRGVSYLVALTQGATIVEARVSADESTSDDLVEAGAANFLLT